MIRNFSHSLVCVAIMLAACQIAKAEHFAIQLSVSSPSQIEQQQATADTNTPQRQHGFKPRPVVHVKANEELTLQFFVTSNFPHDTIHDVRIVYYVVPEPKAAQQAIPSRELAIVDGKFVMDFKPNTGKVGLRQRMKIAKPGTYLVRVESENSDADHEHFAALDLVVD